DLAQRYDLRGGKTGARRLAGLALDTRRIEATSSRIREDVVGNAVAGVALGFDGRGDRRNLVWRNEARIVESQRARVPDSGRQQFRPRVRRSAGKDPIVIGRVALRFHQ